MIPHLSRLFELWRIAAHYRLDRLVDPSLVPAQLRPALRLIKLHPAAYFSKRYDQNLSLKLAIEEMGPLFIKLGQLLSTRRDLIPPHILSQLVLLQDRVKPFSVDDAIQRIEAAFSQPIDQLFIRFDQKPLAAASIAQVHTACDLQHREVIVKVTRPDIKPQILQDFEILTWLGERLEHKLEAARAVHLSEVIQQYKQIILKELDLRLEAENSARMRHYFTGSRMMYVPEVYASTEQVMVAERITGVPISDTSTFDNMGMDRADLAEKGLTIFFTQVFRDNFFHADMHPGNVFVETLNPANPRYIALDCAIMGELSKHDQMIVARLLLAVMNSNFSQLIHIAHQAGWIPPGTNQDALAKEVQHAISPMISKPMDELDFAAILMQVMDIARRFHLEIPPQLLLLLKTLVHVEGLGKDLYPKLDIWKLAKPILTEWVKTNIEPRQQLKSLVQQVPDMLMGAQDFPALVIDSLHGLRQQSSWNDQQLKALQQIRRDISTQQQNTWLAGGAIGGLLLVSTQVSFWLAVLCSFFAVVIFLWRISKF